MDSLEQVANMVQNWDGKDPTATVLNTYKPVQLTAPAQDTTSRHQPCCLCRPRDVILCILSPQPVSSSQS